MCGANESLINDFFEELPVRFEMLSCSGREEDIAGHLEYYDPDALVVCLYDEKREEYVRFRHVRELLKRRGSALIIAADGMKCDDFERVTPLTADFMARRGRINSCQIMGEQIDSYLNTLARCKRKAKAAEPSADPFMPAASPLAPPTGSIAPPASPLAPAAAPVLPPSAGKLADYTAGSGSLDDLLAAAAEAVEEMAAMPPVQRAPGERRRVLVVDDDSSMLRMIKDILGDHYDVAAAISGKVALKFLESRRTDLILLDYEMPGQNGAEVYEKILQNPALQHIPVIFLTGVSDRERIAEVLEMRPRGYLLKPIDSERLRKTVAEIVG